MPAEDPREYLRRIRIRILASAPDCNSNLAVFEHAAVRVAVDKLLRHVKSRLEAIEKDGRFKQPPALVEVNAPLALIQVAMKSEYDALTKVLAYLYRITGGG